LNIALAPLETGCPTGCKHPEDIPPLDGEGPLWLQIRRSIALAILNGDWPAGTRIPPELVLTEHYNTSRMTVNKAVQSLATEGLLQRRTKVGTVVTERARERPVMEIWDAADSIRRDGRRYSYKLLECETVRGPSPLRALIDVDDETPLIRMRCLHSADNRPFQLVERLVNVDAAPQIGRQPLETISPGAWLLAHVPWTNARHSITARGADERIARHLAIEVGEACLIVERRTWNGDIPVTFGRFWHPGDDHRLEGNFRPSW
jgi:GntR family histidine utilization transcriptional repressor